MNRYLPLVAVLATLLATPATAQIDPAKVVAVVNGEEIKSNEYYRRMEFLPGIGKSTANAFTEMPPGLWTLDQLITERLVLQLAREKGVFPTDAELANEINQLTSENPDLMNFWKSSGRTEEEYRDQVRVQLAQFKLQTMGVTVTDSEVERLYRTNIANYTSPRQFALSVIAVDSPANRDAVDKDLADGKAFGDVARARSIDVSKLQDGRYGTIPETQLGAVIKGELDKIKVGGVTQWIESSINSTPVYMKFRLDDVIAERVEQLTPALRRRIRKQRMIELGVVRNDVAKMMIEQRKKAKVDIRNGFADAYKTFIDAYLKQPENVGRSGGG